MGDFQQSGLITTFHDLSKRPVEELEDELMSFKAVRPMSLVLPSLFSELEGEALPGILDELTQVPYLDQIVIGLDRADREQYKYATDYFGRLPQDHVILWNDGPRLRAIDDKLKALDLAPTEMGKGRNVWYCFGYVLASGRAETVALHDCDILTYERGMLARLLYPVANPVFSYEFCKGYYARVSEAGIGGRVCRLFVTPVLRALMKVCGYSNYLVYLDSFRYPLAGEFAMRYNVVQDLRIPSDWGLEIGVISEMHRSYSSKKLCQVDIADTYDHKHQDLSPEDKEKGLSKMSTDIAKAFFRKLATKGEIFSTEKIRSIKATYYRIALDFVDAYQHDAMMNGLSYDRHAEEQAIELFAENIMRAGDIFLEHSTERPFIPSWQRVMSAVPDILDQIKSAVEEDAAEISS